MRAPAPFLALFVFLSLIQTDLTAQGVGSAGLHPVLLQVLEGAPGFTSEAIVKLEGDKPRDAMTLAMQFEYLKGSMRAEINMAKVKSNDIQGEMILTLKQIGMDRVVTIMQGDSKPAIILYPNLNASVEIAGWSKASDKKETTELKETKVGEETVAEHLCDKYRIFYEEQEAFVWRARDMKSFPIQVRIDQANVHMTVRYDNVKLEAPAADRFEVPKGFKKYDSMDAVMQAAMQRLLQKREP